MRRLRSLMPGVCSGWNAVQPKPYIIVLKIKLLPFAFLCFSSANAQNLIANGGFEEINICSEFYAKCAPEAWFHIPLINPVSRANLPPAFSGKLYETFVMENLEGLRNHRFFLYTRLLCPLKAGAQYKLSFYMNSLQIETFQFGALVSTIRPTLYWKPALLKSVSNAQDRCIFRAIPTMWAAMLSTWSCPPKEPCQSKIGLWKNMAWPLPYSLFKAWASRIPSPPTKPKLAAKPIAV